MVELHGTMLGGTLAYETGVEIMRTITPIVRAGGLVGGLLLAMACLLARPHDTSASDLEA